MRVVAAVVAAAVNKISRNSSPVSHKSSLSPLLAVVVAAAAGAVAVAVVVVIAAVVAHFTCELNSGLTGAPDISF